MKKALSLALALVMCLGLTLPACAAESKSNSAGNTVTDQSGNVYTLSNPILYEIPASSLANLSREDGFNPLISENKPNVYYAVPEGTVVTAPDGVVLFGVDWVEIAFRDDGTAYQTQAAGGGYPETSSELDDVNTFWIFPCHQAADNPSETMDVSDNGPGQAAAGDYAGAYLGSIGFFTPADSSADNPFSSSPSAPTNPTAPNKPAFTDVATNAYYADAVAWAVDKSITAGTSTTTFSPNETCSTAQILTFLWRSQGQPEPTVKNPFSDIKESDYFYKAALWAAEEGLVSGSAFGGNTPCTRSATVTYLWKLAGSPSAPAASFSDVPSDADYAQAVAFAVNAGITSGTGAATFSPEETCTRGQIVTFLYRAFAK